MHTFFSVNSKGRDHLGDLGIDENVILKWISRKQRWGYWINLSGSGQEPVAGFCDRGNEPSGSVKAEEFLYFTPLQMNFETNEMWHFKTYVVDPAKSCDSSVGIGLDDRGSRVRFPAGTGNFSLHHWVQNGSGAHPASYPMGIRSSFPWSKAAGAWSWPLTSI